MNSNCCLVKLSNYSNIAKELFRFFFHIGQHNDARMNLAIGLTAARQGACLANHTEVLKLLKEKDPKSGEEKICGATVKDRETGKNRKSFN